jgi:hypothetical protein
MSWGAAPAMSDFDLHQWFGRGELQPCPVCGNDGQITLPSSGQTLCIVCGHLSAAAPQAPESTNEDPPQR